MNILFYVSLDGARFHMIKILMTVLVSYLSFVTNHCYHSIVKSSNTGSAGQAVFCPGNTKCCSRHYRNYWKTTTYYIFFKKLAPTIFSHVALKLLVSLYLMTLWWRQDFLNILRRMFKFVKGFLIHLIERILFYVWVFYFCFYFLRHLNWTFQYTRKYRSSKFRFMCSTK